MIHVIGTKCPTILICALVVTAMAIAQGQVTKRITLAEAVQAALRNNHDLLAARFEVERADARVREARGYALPTIDLTGRYTRALKKSVFFLPNFFASDSTKRNEVVPIQIGSDNSFDVTFSATQVLFNSAVFTGVGTAKVYSQAARQVCRSKEMESVTHARKGFYGVLVAGEVQAMMHANLKNAEDNLHNVRVLAQQGLVSEYDELRAEVAVENLRPEVIRADNNYDLALNNLKIAMGIPFNEEIEVDGTLEFQPMDEGVVRNAIETVIDGNPMLSALRLQSEVNDAVIRVERSSFLPSIAAFGNYQYQAQKNTWKISTGDFVSSSLVGVALSLNIFNGLRTVSRVEQAELDLKKSQEQIAGTETALRTSAQSTIFQLRRAQQRIDAQKRTVEQAERGYRIAATRFKSGAGTQLEVNDAQLALTQAKVNRIQAIFDYAMASADLDQMLGRLPEYARSSIE